MDQNHVNSGERASFWKTNSRAVPGRPSPKQMNKFRDYQQSVSDAWDLGDDEFCIISGLSDAKISKRVANSAAMNVIKTHRNSIGTTSQQQLVTSKNSRNQTSGTDKGLSLANNNNFSRNNDSEEEESEKNGEKEEDKAKNSKANHNQISESNRTDPSESDDNFRPASPTENKRKPRHLFHLYPGRPQLMKLSSNLSKDVENESKLDKFASVLGEPLLNMMDLKRLSWSGVPKRKRPVTWRLLSGYLPTCLERRNPVLERKRLDYLKLVDQYFTEANRDEGQEDTFRQIHIDVPRMNPHVPLFQQRVVQEMFERILFIWAIRHPASGYVQGINDLVTPFFIIFLQEALDSNVEIETFLIEGLPAETRDIIEADSFWCLSKFLDCIQDNYIFAQLGIQAKVNQLKELIQRIDINLHRHLIQHQVDYLQFSFRWMNNLLTRELPLHCTIRLWDTYLAESDGFAVFQLYVCAAFLLHWRDQLLQEKDFQGLMLMLQNLPTHNWTDSHISILLAEAHRLKFTYADAPKHFEGKS